MVEVFKTNVHAACDASKVVALLRERFPGYVVSFDLDDCDRVLRVAGSYVSVDEINGLVTTCGFTSAVLVD